MITGELKSKVDRIWDTMWSGGISNPLSVIEQLTYLLFIKRLDELHALEERKANRTGKPIADPIFSADEDHLRWSRFKETAPDKMLQTVRDEVFPFIKTLGQRGGTATDGDSTYSHHMKDAIFMMPTARVLANVVDQLDGIDMADSDTKGDLYEYMLGKIASAGQNGQFRTPRHIIKLMVDMTAPTPKDVIGDPACGTAGFLISASEHLRQHHSDAIYKDATSRRRFNEGTFHGYDFDSTMLRIGSMNLLLHGVENPDIRYKDSLAQTDELQEEKFSLILANPPFAGSLDHESTAKDLQQIVKTKKTELLFIALFLRLLQIGGRAAVIVPDGVLFGSSKAHRALREILVEKHKLDAIVSMPSGVFRPYAGVSTAILFFTKTNSGGTDDVWFYDMHADGFSLDDKRNPQPEKSDLPDILTRWQNRKAETGPPTHRPQLPRAKSRDRRQGLRSLDQPLQGSRIRSRRTRCAQRDSRAIGKAGGGDRRGTGGVGGDVGVKIAPKRLSDLCATITKGTTPTTLGMRFPENGIPFIRVNNFKERTLAMSRDMLFVSNKTHRALSRSVIKGGDVLLSIAGTIGRCCVVPHESPEANCNQAVCVIRTKSDLLNNRYLERWLGSEAAASQLSNGRVTGVISNLSLTNVRNLDIFLPPLAQQKRIARLLDAADALRAKRRESLAQLDALLQSSFLTLFGDPRIGWSRGRIKTQSLKLGEAVKIRTGKLDANAADVDGAYPFFTCAIKSLRINTAAFDTKAVLVAGNGDLNVKYYEGKFNAYQRTYVIETQGEGALNPRFLHIYLDIYVSELRKKAIGGVIKYIKLPYLTDAPLELPDIEAQRHFAAIVESVERQKSRLRAHLAELDALFASLQSRAFNGEL